MARKEQLKKTFGSDKNKLLTFKIVGGQTPLNKRKKMAKKPGLAGACQ